MSSHPRPTSHSQSGQQHQTGANGHRGPLLVNGHRQSLQQHQDQKRNYLGQDQDYDGNDLDQDLNRMRDLPMESPLSQARSNHHPSPAEDRSSSTMRQESHSEQQRSCNGYTYTSTHQDHGQTQSYPTRRLSTSTHSSPVSTVSSTTSISYTSGTAVSTPSSPSHSTLPYSHGDPRYSGQGFEDASTSSGETAGTGTENETEMNVLTRTTHVNGGFTSGQAEGLIRRSRTRSKSHPDLPDVPLMKACQSSSFGCSSPMAILFVISAIVLGCVFHSNFYRQIDASRDCNMTFMQPKHYKLMGFDQERTAFAGKYGLLLFRDQYDYKLHVPQNMITELPYSVLAIDKKFKVTKAEDVFYGQSNGASCCAFSALHGHSLLEQAEYLNDAIAYILSLYDDDRHTDPNSARPTSVLIIGHSMGGIVARSLFTMKNYRPGTVNTILTVATPHMLPPVTLDFEISGIYDRIEAFWTNGFQGGEDAPLKDVSLVSIAGGTLDIIVSGDSGNIHNIVPQSHGFTVFTSSIPHAWVGSDHLSILWCNQIAVVIGKALIDIVDASYPEQVKPLSERMDIFRNRLLTGVDTHLEDPDNIHRDEMYDLKSVAHTFVDSTNQLVYPLDQRSSNVADTNQQHMYILRVPRTQRIDTFNMLTDHLLGAQSRLDVLLCNDISGGPRLNNAQPDRLSCFHNSLSTIPIPASTESTTRPLFAGRNFKGDEFRYATEKMSESTLSDIQYLVLLDRGQKMGEPGFLIAEFVLEADTTVIAETTTLGLLNHGYRIHAFPEKSSLVSTLKLPNIDNSLLTYKIKVERNGCS
ncbi:GPI inositol deacylase, partial [Lunasporangiospora selenospora]